MTRHLPGAAVAVLIALATPVAAQGYDPFCSDLVADICGAQDAAGCFDSVPQNWAKVPEYCTGDVQSMIEDAHSAMAQDLPGDHSAAECRQIVSGLCGGPLDTCLVPGSPAWTDMPNECLAVAQDMLAAESPADNPAAGNYDPGAVGQQLMAEAESWGGNLRSGPGGDYSVLRSLPEGEPLTVLSVTDQTYQGYPWFKVRTLTQEGYHWGGIICQRGGVWVEGISGAC